MDIWPAQDAKARFSELLDACINEGPQVVSRRGTETAVLVPIEEWRQLQRATRRSLKELLLVDTARTEALVPARTRNATASATVHQTVKKTVPEITPPVTPSVADSNTPNVPALTPQPSCTTN